MAKKAELLEKAAELKLAVNEKNTIAEIEEAIAGAEKHEVKEQHVAKSGKRSQKALDEAAEKAEKEARKESGDTTPQDPEATEAKKKGPKPVTRPVIERRGKKYRELAKKIDNNKSYSLTEALSLAIETSPAKFDASVEAHVRLGVDPRQADQNIRATVNLPHGNFDVLIATPQYMAKLGKYARLLGPRGLMPNPKSGTVAADVAKAVTEAKTGKVEYRVDKQAIVHLAFGKVSFGAEKLLGNAEAFFNSLNSQKPSTIKGVYIKSVTIATTMGPGIKVDINNSKSFSIR